MRCPTASYVGLRALTRSRVPSSTSLEARQRLARDIGPGHVPVGRVGLVHDVGAAVGPLEGTTVRTIEGNTSNEVGRRSYAEYATNPEVLGWGRMRAPAQAAA